MEINVPNASSGDEIKLQNLDIKGNLNIDFGEGNLVLENVKVNGIDIKNIGENSLYIKGNSAIGLLIINDSNGNARVVVEENANVFNTSLNSGAKLVVSKGASHSSPFANIVISPTGENGDDEITLEGKFDNIKVEKPSRVNVSSETEIKNKISLESSADLNISEGAKVPKVDISNTTETDKITLSGNIGNVNVQSNVGIEVKSGNVSISASETATVKVDVIEGASLETGKGDIDTSGEGTIKQKENLSDEAKITDTTLFDNTYFYTNEDGTSGMWGVPSGITAAELLDNIVISDFATAVVIDENKNTLSDNEYITRTKKVKVISESGKVETIYNIELKYANGVDYSVISGMGYDWSIYENRFEKDTNNEKGKYTADIKFNGAEDQSGIEGYYIGLSGKKLEEHDGKKHFYTERLYDVFVPKTENREYIAQFKDVDLKGFSMLELMISASIENGIVGWHATSAYDNPIEVELPSTGGIAISEFTDTNNEKGKIGGTVEFTKAQNESNIAYYNVYMIKTYENERSYWDGVGMLQVGDDMDGVYRIDIDSAIAVGMTEDIKIVVAPVSKDGIEGNLEESPLIQITDNPEEGKLEMNKPRLLTNSGSDYSLSAHNTAEGSELRLYKYDSAKDEFILYKRNESEVIGYGSGSYYSLINQLEVGRYKITQTAGGITSEMSEEAVIRPLRLSGILQNGKLSLINAIDGAKITVYNSAGEVVDTLDKVEGETPIVDTSSYSAETYSVTQTIEGIESSRFVIPLGEEYSIKDIEESMIKSLNAANLEASMDEEKTITLRKKSEGSIGKIKIDTGAYINATIMGSISEKIGEKLGSSYIYNTSLISFDVQSDFVTLARDHSEFDMSIEFDGKYYSYKFIIESEEEALKSTDEGNVIEETESSEETTEENGEDVVSNEEEVTFEEETEKIIATE